MDNKIDRLSDLLREFAQEENLSVHMTVRRPSRLTIRYRGKIFCCNAEALRYVTSDGHYCVCHMTQGETRLRISFRDLADQLESMSPGGYPVISRGTLVNQLHVADCTGETLCMDDGTILSISRRDRARILQCLQRPHPVSPNAAASESPRPDSS